MLNKVNLIGRLCQDPEKAGSCCSLLMAVQRDWNSKHTGKRDTDFIFVKCFARSAYFATKYLKKGDWVAVAGRVQAGSWKNSKNKTCWRTEILAEKVYGFGSNQDPVPSKEDAMEPEEHFDEDDFDEDDE